VKLGTQSHGFSPSSATPFSTPRLDPKTPELSNEASASLPLVPL